ncbi:uncharacterized protein TRAVEDRAFT_48165 [Trametes versicolor FP-101664 SS1]|uniref:uncharacterized protein n=1 Tax=Trametes versicolor (strain FP-101664) TaxID=717944 RepID=UPI0004624559|nr:uncharacterized protein TRAVEDRAFT_48165 [Trametes versicolor FP-101664 SS1]EIW59038.1 hypothetical protein TRAVEDRAFT_48165 [Trametes versicolor FP-101664 SS1]
MTHPYEHPKEKAKAPPCASSSTATLVANSSFSKSTITLVGGSDFSASKSMLVAEEKGKTPLSAFRSTSTLVEDETKKIFSCALVAEEKEKGPPSASWSTATADKRFSASTSTLVEDETKKIFSSAFVAEEKEKDPPSASAHASTSDTGPQSRAPAAAGAIGKAKGRSDIHGCYDVYKTVLDGLSNNSPANKQEGLLVLPPSAVTVFERLDKSASWTVLDGPDSIAESRTKSPSQDSKAWTNARASSPPERCPPPKLPFKEPGARHRGRRMQEYIFTEDDEADIRKYSEQARDLREQRQRTAMEGLPASATTSQSMQGGGVYAGEDERSYGGPPVQRTLFLSRSLYRKGEPNAGTPHALDSQLVSRSRIEKVWEDQGARDGADSSDGENSFETAAEGDMPGDDPTVDGTGHRADEKRHER